MTYKPALRSANGMSGRRYPPTATLAERVVLGVSGAVALVFFGLGRPWLGFIAFVPGLGAAVAQQIRGNRERRVLLAALRRDLPSMSDDERDAGIAEFRHHFPDLFAKRKLERELARLRAQSQ